MHRLTRALGLALVGVAALRAGAQTIAITGGTVYPVSGAPITNGTVLMRDGRIVAVGAGVAVPQRPAQPRGQAAGPVGRARTRRWLGSSGT